jgi:hypothetical protein
MTSTYYLVRISASAEVPQAVRDFLQKQSSFHHLDDNDFIFAAPIGQAGLTIR